MSKEARGGIEAVSLAVREKIRELAELIARERCGADGLPEEITFSEIEEWGHQAGRLLAGAARRFSTFTVRSHSPWPTQAQLPQPFTLVCLRNWVR